MIYQWLVLIVGRFSKIIICDQNCVYGFYFARFMNIIFNELHVKHDVHTISKNPYTPFFIAYYFCC